jgi:Mitochondrial carrier protein
MQVHGSKFRSGWTCAKTVYRGEGLGAFYVSYPTTLMMTVPFTAVQFTSYEYLKETFNPSGQYSPVTHVVAGGLAGGVAAAVTTPLDVAKTLLQTKGTSEDRQIRGARGVMDACRIIWARNGVWGFFRGVTPRVVTFMPSNALCWLSYEFFSECPLFILSFVVVLTRWVLFALHRKSDGQLRSCHRAIGLIWIVPATWLPWTSYTAFRNNTLSVVPNNYRRSENLTVAAPHVPLRKLVSTHQDADRSAIRCRCRDITHIRRTGGNILCTLLASPPGRCVKPDVNNL